MFSDIISIITKVIKKGTEECLVPLFMGIIDRSHSIPENAWIQLHILKQYKKVDTNPNGML